MSRYSETAEYCESYGIEYRYGVTGRECTTFKTGGATGLFVEVKTLDEAAGLLAYLKDTDTPFYLIGNGSNLLIPDEGCDKVFVKLSGELTRYRIEGNTVFCGAGASLSAVSKNVVASGLMGLEWAAGIPGTVGGGIAMNAGAYGGEIKQVLRSVTAYTQDGIKEIEIDPSKMGYRFSKYSYPEMVVLEARFELAPDDGKAKERMDDYSARRKEKQPLSYPSAGSTFKRPEGYYAGALIEGAGLKGYSVGGACVSCKHAGFIINKDGAKASDVIELIDRVRQTVFEKYGVMLEPEVRILK